MVLAPCLAKHPKFAFASQELIFNSNLFTLSSNGNNARFQLSTLCKNGHFKQFERNCNLNFPTLKCFSSLDPLNSSLSSKSSNSSTFSTSELIFSSQKPWSTWEIDHKAYSNPRTELMKNNSPYNIPPPLLSVAPMMEWTDNHYRYLARLLSRHTWLHTEMVVASTIVYQKDNLDRILEFSEFQHPISLQIGGNDPMVLSKASSLALHYGYDEMNLNCGCPSDAVAGAGCFGARLMLNPHLVADCMNRIHDACGMPVTVKCRIGVDDFDNYEYLCEFVHTVSENSPVRHFIVHARKALLKGLSPAENRTIPPLKYEYVFALMNDFPNLKFTLNGGIKSLPMAMDALERGVHGVMIGRSAYNSPWSILGDADRKIYGVPNTFSNRRQVLEEYTQYADDVIGRYRKNHPNVRALVKPLLNLFHGEMNACVWRREIDRVLRHATTVGQVLEETLIVLPDEVLDAPPPLSPPDSPLSLPLSLPQEDATFLPSAHTPVVSA